MLQGRAAQLSGDFNVGFASGVETLGVPAERLSLIDCSLNEVTERAPSPANPAFFSALINATSASSLLSDVAGRVSGCCWMPSKPKEGRGPVEGS
jgi:hypothetical protein